LILRNTIKIVATRCQILRLKCTRFDFGWGLPPAGGAYTAPRDLLAGFKRPTSKIVGYRKQPNGIPKKMKELKMQYSELS